MQKKLIALAIASALTVPAMAYASDAAAPAGGVTVYGNANLSINRVSDGAATSSTTNQLVNNESRVGVKGSEDLGDGMSVVFQLEGNVPLDAPNDGAFSFDRTSYLGLSSHDMGTVLVGRLDTPYKSSTRKLDVFGYVTGADNRTLMSYDVNGFKHDTRLNNAIAYVSPSMGGMSVAAATEFGAEEAASTATKGSAISLAGMYSMDAIYATLAYQSVKFGTAGSGDLGAAGVDNETKALKAGASYSMDAFTVNAVVEQITSKVAATSAETKGTNLYLAGKFALSDTDAVKLAYTKKGKTKAATENQDGVTRVSLGYDHAMSKSTTVYALYSKDTADTGGFSWAADHTTHAGMGADPSIISVGLMKSF